MSCCNKFTLIWAIPIHYGFILLLLPQAITSIGFYLHLFRLRYTLPLALQSMQGIVLNPLPPTTTTLPRPSHFVHSSIILDSALSYYLNFEPFCRIRLCFIFIVILKYFLALIPIPCNGEIVCVFSLGSEKFLWRIGFMSFFYNRAS